MFVLIVDTSFTILILLCVTMAIQIVMIVVKFSTIGADSSGFMKQRQFLHNLTIHFPLLAPRAIPMSRSKMTLDEFVSHDSGEVIKLRATVNRYQNALKLIQKKTNEDSTDLEAGWFCQQYYDIATEALEETKSK